MLIGDYLMLPRVLLNTKMVQNGTKKNVFLSPEGKNSLGQSPQEELEESQTHKEFAWKLSGKEPASKFCPWMALKLA